MTPAELDEIEALLSKSTQGTWKTYWAKGELETNCGIFSEKHEGQAYSVCRAPRYQTKEQWLIDSVLITSIHNAARDLLADARQNLRRGKLLERIDLATCYGKIPKELIEDIAKELP